MRAKLLLTTAVATLSLCLSQANAQTSGPDRDVEKPGQSAAEARQPGERGATHKDREERAQERREGQKAQGAQEHEAQGAREARPGDSAEKSREEERRGAAMKGEERHGAPGVKEKEKEKARKGAQREQTPSEAKKAETQEQSGHPGQTPKERMGAKDKEGERRAGEELKGFNNPAGQQGGLERRGETERGQPDRNAAERSAKPNARGAEATPEGRETPRAAGREEQERGAGRQGQERAAGRETQERGFGRDAQERGGGIRLSERQESRVRQMIERRGGGAHLSRNDFNLRIGAAVPPNVRFQPLPPDIVAIAPQFRGYDYVMVENDIAIIDPGTRQVVTVLGEGGGPPPAVYGYEEREGGYGGDYERRDGRYGGGYEPRERYGSAQRGEEQFRSGGRERRGEAYGYAPRVRLDTRQERALYRGVMNEARVNLRQVCVRVGDRVPESVDIEPVPQSIAAEAPDIQRYDYFVLNDQVVLVDPDSRVVVDMIQEPR